MLLKTKQTEKTLNEHGGQSILTDSGFSVGGDNIPSS